MGVSISWLAVQTDDNDSVSALLSLNETGEFGNYADYPIVGRILPSEWYLIVADRCDHELIKSETLRNISSNFNVVACSIEEHCMYCSCSIWEGGSEQFFVEHKGDESFYNLETKGEPPSGYDEIKEKYYKEQEKEGGEEAEVDMFFEIPNILAKSLTGFKHDEVIEGVEDSSFLILSSTKFTNAQGRKKPWWKFW
jgi:hypothetical protein